MKRTPAYLVVALLAVSLLATGCTDVWPLADESPSSSPATSSSTPTPSPSPSASPTEPTAAKAPRPKARTCYLLDFKQALAPTNDSTPVECSKRHTSMTFAVGPLDTYVAGHLLAVDSAQVQDQIASICPQRLAEFLGGRPEDLRLSMLRAVWFTPTVEQSDAGSNWYRCDVIAVAKDGVLTKLTGRLAGVLSQPETRSRYAICGVGEPGTRAFSRIICSRTHEWRAIRSVTFKSEEYPGKAAAKEAGQQVCQQAAANLADNVLNFQWSYEWPTEKQWEAGQNYGLCWAPE